MQSIHDLNSQISNFQDKANSQAHMAQQERDKAEEARANEDLEAMRAHLDAAARYDVAALQFQNQISNAQIRVRQDQSLINSLNDKRARLIEAHEEELRRIDLEIQQASGQ